MLTFGHLVCDFVDFVASGNLRIREFIRHGAYLECVFVINVFQN